MKTREDILTEAYEGSRFTYLDIEGDTIDGNVYPALNAMDIFAAEVLDWVLKKSQYDIRFSREEDTFIWYGETEKKMTYTSAELVEQFNKLPIIEQKK